MTWEIALGFFAIISTFLGVMKVAVKVNRTLNMLEAAVNRLNEQIERQNKKTRGFSSSSQITSAVSQKSKTSG